MPFASQSMCMERLLDLESWGSDGTTSKACSRSMAMLMVSCTMLRIRDGSYEALHKGIKESEMQM